MIPICDEKVSREKVRKSFQTNAKHSFAGKLWIFVNSSFGLWLLYSLTLMLAISLYASLLANNSVSALHAETVRKLEIELSARLSTFKSQIEETLHKTAFDAATIKNIAANFDAADNGASTQRISFAAFAEYREVGYDALIAQLGSLAKQDNKEEIRKARNALDNLKKKLQEIQVQEFEPNDTTPPRAASQSDLKMQDSLRKIRGGTSKDFTYSTRSTLNKILQALKSNRLLKRWSEG